MTRPVLILRPEPGNHQTCKRAEALGLTALAAPLFAVESLPWTVPPDDLDALLLTSANAVRHAGEGLLQLNHLPVWTVGEATAKAAREAGLAVERVGDAGVIALLTAAPPTRLLHLCGEDRTPMSDLQQQITDVAVYVSRPITPPEDFPAWLASGPIALLHSPRAAQHFAELVDESRQDRGAISLVAISTAAGHAAGPGWEMVAIADQTSDDTMLNLARDRVADRIRVQT